MTDLPDTTTHADQLQPTEGQLGYATAKAVGLKVLEALDFQVDTLLGASACMGLAPGH